MRKTGQKQRAGSKELSGDGNRAQHQGQPTRSPARSDQDGHSLTILSTWQVEAGEQGSLGYLNSSKLASLGNMIPCLKLNKRKPTLRSEKTEQEKGSQSESGKWTPDTSQMERTQETQTSQRWHHEKWAGQG